MIALISFHRMTLLLQQFCSVKHPAVQMDDCPTTVVYPVPRRLLKQLIFYDNDIVKAIVHYHHLNGHNILAKL